MRLAIFVRHGQSVTNVKFIESDDLQGYPLTKHGREQAEKVGMELARINKIDALYTSPIQRTRETAEIIGKRIEMKPKIDRRLVERRAGRMNNRQYASTENLRESALVELLAGFPSGKETLEEMEKRILAFEESIDKKAKVTVAVTHGDTIKALLANFLKMDELNTFFGFDLLHCSLTIIDLEKKKVLAIGSPIVPEEILKGLNKT